MSVLITPDLSLFCLKWDDPLPFPFSVFCMEQELCGVLININGKKNQTNSWELIYRLTVCSVQDLHGKGLH